jgi:hypothetical protein
MTTICFAIFTGSGIRSHRRSWILAFARVDYFHKDKTMCINILINKTSKSFGYRSGEDSTISFERRRTLSASKDLIEDQLDPEVNQSC